MSWARLKRRPLSRACVTRWHWPISGSAKLEQRPPVDLVDKCESGQPSLRDETAVCSTVRAGRQEGPPVLDSVALGLNRTQLLPFAYLRCPLVHSAEPNRSAIRLKLLATGTAQATFAM
jgi:hypothetical protein